MVPGSVGQRKLERTFDFIWSLPVPRGIQATSTFLLYTLLSLPGTVLALAEASWRYGIHLSISPEIVPGMSPCALTSFR